MNCWWIAMNPGSSCESRSHKDCDFFILSGLEYFERTVQCRAYIVGLLVWLRYRPGPQGIFPLTNDRKVDSSCSVSRQTWTLLAQKLLPFEAMNLDGKSHRNFGHHEVRIEISTLDSNTLDLNNPLIMQRSCKGKDAVWRMELWYHHGTIMNLFASLT